MQTGSSSRHEAAAETDDILRRLPAAADRWRAALRGLRQVRVQIYLDDRRRALRGRLPVADADRDAAVSEWRDAGRVLAEMLAALLAAGVSRRRAAAVADLRPDTVQLLAEQHLADQHPTR